MHDLQEYSEQSKSPKASVIGKSSEKSIRIYKAAGKSRKSECINISRKLLTNVKINSTTKRKIGASRRKQMV